MALSTNCINDSTKLRVRLPLKAGIEKFVNDPDFQYTRDITPPTNWWGKFLQWLSKWLSKLFGGLGYDNFWQYVFIAIIVIVVVWVILKLMGVSMNDLFYRKNAATEVPYETVNEDVRLVDFDPLINQALDNRNYRLAVRLFYLKTLKELNKQRLINWKPEKTNSNYLNELSAIHLKDDFRQMTLQFEYVWYGEFELDEQAFLKIRQSFLAFNKQVNGK
ncbi:DUF4129 domain-containing protein [Solitalea lacus]|uniref:DUF4129 domain-containing protein n=1 Tax=Solitalea lacus TaxID=2911172 RepID=UPI001EDC0A9B|nr:DUF4129 domain-containing protein [Solitalea lacus]UKJ08171.1 DUF4129 domain-containing protein [Solitalea lacus]